MRVSSRFQMQERESGFIGHDDSVETVRSCGDTGSGSKQ
jgi:hypothetical protein